ncbi:MAG: hypothetical protein AAFU79_35780, partial [Myxococcota bacterium]
TVEYLAQIFADVLALFEGDEIANAARRRLVAIAEGQVQAANQLSQQAYDALLFGLGLGRSTDRSGDLPPAAVRGSGRLIQTRFAGSEGLEAESLPALSLSGTGGGVTVGNISVDARGASRTEVRRLAMQAVGEGIDQALRDADRDVVSE